MDPSSVQQHQQMSNQSLENMIACSKAQERKPRPQPEEALKCPRCDSTNTKFCYYNNYSLSQPRYFCKSCRRYWTKGGTLRNVPVGGGCRKNKRSSSSSSSSKRVQDHQPLTPTNNPLTASSLSPLSFDSNDLTLALARLQKHPCTTGLLGNFDDHDLSILGNPTSCAHYDHLLGNPTNPAGFLDAFRSDHGFMESQNNDLQSLYCGYGNGDMGEVDNGNASEVGVSGEMMLPYDQEAVTVTTMKQEIMCNGRSEQSENNRVLWGLPWQLNGDINMNAGLESAAGRASWNNGLNSTWHGLLNSPLM